MIAQIKRFPYVLSRSSLSPRQQKPLQSLFCYQHPVQEYENLSRLILLNSRQQPLSRSRAQEDSQIPVLSLRQLPRSDVRSLSTKTAPQSLTRIVRSCVGSHSGTWMVQTGSERRPAHPECSGDDSRRRAGDSFNKIGWVQLRSHGKS
jgi:hypothetical protein